MATKIRLARHGRKKRAFYHIVVADSRAPRDGKFIERIGSYNPNTNPATIDLDVEKAVNWIEKGAQPTDTAKAIMSYKGAMLKVHLNKGVKKGAFTQEQAEEKFATWLSEKEGKVTAKVDSLNSAKSAQTKAAMDAESARKEAVQAKIDAKLAVDAAAETADDVVEAPEMEAADAEVNETEVTEVAEVTEEAAPEAEAPEATEPEA